MVYLLLQKARKIIIDLNQLTMKGKFWEMLNQQAGGAIAAGMGLILGDHYDRRQLKQQRKLMELEMEGQRSMADYNMSKQLEMWKQTNYAAQVEQMKKAGLNPALQYGMGGGGGVTSGTPSGNVAGAHAPGGGKEVEAMLGLGIQYQLLQAQKENIQAQTEKTKTETTKIGGVDTQAQAMHIKTMEETIDKIRAEVQSTQASTEQTKAQTLLTGLETAIKQLDKQFLEGTMQDRIKQAEYECSQAMRKLQLLDNEQKLSAETYDSMVLQIRQKATNEVILGALMGSEIGKNISQTQLNTIEGRLKNLDLEFYADRMHLEKLEVEIKKALQEAELDPSWQLYKALIGAAGTIIGAGILKGTTVTTGAARAAKSATGPALHRTGR